LAAALVVAVLGPAMTVEMRRFWTADVVMNSWLSDS
jgi:hypothetical protein